MTPESHHELRTIPHDLVGRAIKDMDFREQVLARKDNKDDLNQYLEEKGYAPIGDEAYDVISRLNLKDVNDALSGVDSPKALAS